ncbi:60 kDa chaperonin [Methanosarcinaceae archaeon Ag5]|uniref:60 kDa chaperonin n=1 Tax=Methanolapillus africanus TaxID=3028297 RepID=A0AAE4MHZ1_9EURY|nr:60 kDa chaperonin [Methanosarcinaceae archaeon Ag5]
MAKTGPIIVLDPGKERTKGTEAIFMNITAAKTVASLVQSTLGPKGMDKMLINKLGVVSMTNDGVTILKDIGIEHPAAKMIVEVSKTLESTAGDGTTSSVIFSAALLDKAEKMIKKGFHPTVIIKGFKIAEEKALEVLNDRATDVKVGTPAGREILKKAAMTSITGKAPDVHKEHLAEVCVKAAEIVEKRGFVNVRSDVLEIVELNRRMEETEVLEGIALSTNSLNKNAPSRIENPKIAVLNAEIEVHKTKAKSKMVVGSPEERNRILENEIQNMLDVAKQIADTGANVIFSTKMVKPVVLEYFDKRGIYVSRPIEEKDAEHVSYATGAKIIKNVREISSEDLGEAKLMEQEVKNGVGKTFIRDAKNSKVATIIVRGETLQHADSVSTCINDALWVVKSIIEDGKVVAGGGASEMEVALALRAYAPTIGGYEQRVVAAYADAIEELPKTIIKNGGLDVIDLTIALRAAHTKDKNAGVNVFTGKVVDMEKEGVIDPLRVKLNTIKSATEASVMILRIDDVLRAKYTREMPDVKPEHMATSYSGKAPPKMDDRR